MAEALQVPVGFYVAELKFKVPGARQMALTDGGTLLVGSRRQGVVYAVPDALTLNTPEVIKVVEGLTMPTGLTLLDGDLYIAALNEVVRIDDVERTYTDPEPNVVTRDLPTKRHHGWKYIKFGPDGYLYVPVGAPCNNCLSGDPRFASLLRMDAATGETEVWAAGIRNTVGFAWHPNTGDLWFSDNGRDRLGDDVPPEEINVSTRKGQHFGYPFIHGGDLPDPKYAGHDAQPEEMTGPVVKIQAHSAALGMAFYTGDAFPGAYKNALFVAEHGSWNRSSKVGYQVSVMTDADGQAQYEPFVTGWLKGQHVSGRPNDVLVTPGGELLISDDQRGVIYRVTYLGEKD